MSQYLDFILDAKENTDLLGHTLLDSVVNFSLVFNICHIILTLQAGFDSLFTLCSIKMLRQVAKKHAC